MATVPKHLHLGEEQNRNRLNGVSTDQPLHNATPESKRSQTISTAELRRIRSFTTEDLPSSTKPLLPPRSTGRPTSVSDSIQSELESEKLEEEKESIGGLAESETLALLNHKDFSRRKASQRVAKLGTLIIDKVKKSFTKDESERILRSDWVMIETEEGQLKDFQQSIIKLVKAFKFSKSTTLINLATSTLKRCEILVERCSVHAEKCHMMFSHCSNEMSTLQDYLGKMRCCVIPPPSPVGVTPSSTVQRDKTEELRNARRVEWAVSRMTQILQSILADMTESLDELDEMIRHCTKLMVQVITLLHMRGRSADFSGTGVAAGAASVVAGAVVRSL
jgi:hypothetical protein